MAKKRQVLFSSNSDKGLRTESVVGEGISFDFFILLTRTVPKNNISPYISSITIQLLFKLIF